MKVCVIDGKTFSVDPAMDDGSVLVRQARKVHQCAGGHNGQRHTPCTRPILSGDTYVEYTGETAMFRSGARYHPQCAIQQGLLREITP